MGTLLVAIGFIVGFVLSAATHQYCQSCDCDSCGNYDYCNEEED
jgi:hypothetical protein